MKKAAALALMVAMAIAAGQPAMAGVGGCKFPGVGGCGSWNLEAAPTSSPSVLDNLRGALPVDVFTFLKAMFEQQRGDGPVVVEEPQIPSYDGVGGCFGRLPGVGGCAL